MASIYQKISIRVGIAGLLLLFSLPAWSGFSGSSQILIDDFEQGLRPDWERQTFRKRSETLYEVIELEGRGGLRAWSRGSASGLVMRKGIDPLEFPLLEWRWKVQNIHEKGDARVRDGDDYAARIYVIFQSGFWARPKVLNYIWANRLPVGQQLPNSYYSGAMMIAVQSGGEHVGAWKTERRNLLEDYRRAFGSEPTMIEAVAVMTDSDDTGGAAVAYYDFIRFLQAR
jgi:hypothetical protein